MGYSGIQGSRAFGATSLLDYTIVREPIISTTLTLMDEIRSWDRVRGAGVVRGYECFGICGQNVLEAVP